MTELEVTEALGPNSNEDKRIKQRKTILLKEQRKYSNINLKLPWNKKANPGRTNYRN